VICYNYVLKPNGRKKWRYRINEYAQSVAKVDDKGASYITTKDKGVFAFSPQGRKLWHHPGNSVFFGDDDAYVGGKNSISRCKITDSYKSEARSAKREALLEQS